MKPLLRTPDDRASDCPLSAPGWWEEAPEDGQEALERSKGALDFIQNCPHTKGDLRENKKRLGDTWLWWQEKATRHLFGTLRDDGKRRYRTAYIEMPKKSGKSHWLAAVMLYLLGPGTKPGAELYSAAYDHGQAMVVWGIARQMCKIAGWDQRRLEVRDYQGCWEMENRASDSQYEPLTRKAASKHGFNPYAVAFDELHQQPDREFWDTIDGSMGAWDEPLLIAITNAGHDRESICYKQRQYAMKNNEDEFDDSFLGVVYGLSSEHSGVGEPDDWQRANPGVPVTVDLDTVARKARKAERQPSELNAFQRWQLGIWTRAVSRWISPEVWDAAYEDYEPEDVKGHACYGGLDLGMTHDMSAWVLAFQDPDDSQLVRVLCRAFCPEERLYDDENPYRDSYQAWARDKWLTVIEGQRTTDFGEVRRQVVEDAETFGMTDMAMDRYQGAQLSIELEEDEGLAVAGMGQGYASMSAPCDAFERRLLADPPKIRHRGNPVLTWAVQNVALKTNREGEKKMPTKDSEEALIDPVVALLMALDGSMRHEEPTPSAWEDEDKEMLLL